MAAIISTTLLIAGIATASAQTRSGLPASTVGPNATPPGQQINYVFIVMEENHSFTNGIGNS
jgi:phospholipase C